MIRSLPKRTYWIAISASTVLAVFCIVIYMVAKNKLDQELESQIHNLGTIVVQDVERTVRNNIRSLENLKDRIEESEGKFMDHFETDASRIIKQHSAIKFIEWIDRDGIIQKIHPLEENRAAYLLDIKPIKYRYTDWLINSENDKSNMTAWVDLTQKGNAFLVDVPIFIKGEFYGTVSAGMDFKTQFDNLNKNLDDILIRLSDEEGKEFYNFNELSTTDFEEMGTFSSNVQPILGTDKVWSFQLLFDDNALYKERGIIQKTALSYGVLISLLIGLLFVYILQSRKRTEEQIVINNTLTQLNKELKEQKLAAQKASLHKSDFISNMSHEIRTPLNAILGFVEILGAKNLLRNEQLYLKLMKNSSQNLLGLVNDILDINKIEAGQAVISKDVFKPSENLKQVLSTYGSQIIENKLQLKVDIDDTYNHSVVSDSPKFDQIITNILGNAIKFTAKGSIHVYYQEYLSNSKLLVTYTITDTGYGIPKNKINSIFKRFVQVENGTRKRHVGGGLGLAITYELIQLLGGTIAVKSKINKGSSFTVTLPMTIASKPISKEAIQIKNLSSLKCLIVDDNRINRMILFNFLQETGIQVDSVGSGKDALKKAKLTKYDIIFMDIHMPDMDGFEATQEVLKIHPTTTIIGVSADVTIEAIQKGKVAGMKDYLTKPMDKNTLFKTLNKLYYAKATFKKKE